LSESNAFITTYLTKPKMERHPHKDWPVSFEVLQRLAESVQPYGELIVCADELQPRHVPKALRGTVTVFPVTAPIGNVYFERWDLVRDVLTQRTDLTFAYAVDARDVIVMKDPWEFIEPRTLYTCTEVVSHRILPRWRGQPLGLSGFINDKSFHSSPIIQRWIRQNPDLVALNAGVTGADRETLLAFATLMADRRLEAHVANDYTDMSLFNFVAYNSGFPVVGSEEFIGAKCNTAAEAPRARVIHVP
jgi:hypothetical protein